MIFFAILTSGTKYYWCIDSAEDPRLRRDVLFVAWFAASSYSAINIDLLRFYASLFVDTSGICENLRTLQSSFLSLCFVYWLYLESIDILLPPFASESITYHRYLTLLQRNSGLDIMAIIAVSFEFLLNIRDKIFTFYTNFYIIYIFTVC